MMVSDELPQLLHHLLVSVERTIGRISFNELKIPSDDVPTRPLSYNYDDDATFINNIKTDSGVSINNNYNETIITKSPICFLRKSDLITNNKKVSYGNKIMLRRLTTRQDSINLTSSGNSCTSVSSTSSCNTNEIHMANNIGHNNTSQTSSSEACDYGNPSSSPALPLFCLGNSFPHIDSDEENGDDKLISIGCDEFQFKISTPKSILDIPEKLLMSGIILPGTRDLKGHPLIIVDATSVLQAGLNCYEIATIMLYYSTIPDRKQFQETKLNTQVPLPQTEQSQQQPIINSKLAAIAHTSSTEFTILIAIENAHQQSLIDLICQSLKVVEKTIGHCEIHAVCLDSTMPFITDGIKFKANNTLAATSIDSQHSAQMEKQQQYTVKYIKIDKVPASVAPLLQLPCGKFNGLHHHDPRKWREFFIELEPFQRQCSAVGQRLCSAMSDIRSSVLQGLPTRRQLYVQYRALSRALMDSQLHNLRQHGATKLERLQELAKETHQHNSGCFKVATACNENNICDIGNISRHRNDSGTMQNIRLPKSNHSSSNSNIGDTDIEFRLHKVTLLFKEVDHAAKRLEELTEQRRERLRKRALEDNIYEITYWISSDANDTLQRFANVKLDCELSVKEHEQEFEKFYFVSIKHVSKGRDLHEAATKVRTLSESASNFKTVLDDFAVKLEIVRKRFESASSLHRLIDGALSVRHTSVKQEMERLAEKIDLHKDPVKHQLTPTSMNLNPQIDKKSAEEIASLLTVCTPTTNEHLHTHGPWNHPGIQTSSGNSSFFEVNAIAAERNSCRRCHHGVCHCWHERVDEVKGDEDDEVEEEEDCEERQSKIADSGLGVGCEHCEGNFKMSRICSYQSQHDLSHSYGMRDDLDNEYFERPLIRYQDIHSPMKANAHLQCHASSLDLPRKLDELSFLEPKIQKTLLLIIREMIGTERDYVRSLHYVIENYVDELLRDDILQPLRGQRNVIFGNIEKIFEFHNSHFLSELEQYEHLPLKVGAAFLRMESKFYLYALYNKNKPKSDALMSEYGTVFFKSKQLELNDKMDLASYLLKPVQRMGKYALLLQQLVKACLSMKDSDLQEFTVDVEELQRAEGMVKFQLRHGNDLLAMDSLRDCDVNVKEQGRLLRQNEFHVWQGRGGKKTLRQIFLFEELVLFSKARRFPDHKNLDIYIYKNSLKTSDIGLTAHVADSPTKFEIWFRKRKPEDTWTLQCMSEDIKNAWTEEISNLLWKQAKRNRVIRLAEMSSMGIGSKPCLDIRPSNNQINDRFITITQLIKAPKLRHSLVAQPSGLNISSRRPNSLISESSISSGTSSSSLSTGSSLGNERMACQTAVVDSALSKSTIHALELINETQTLMLDVSPNYSITEATANINSRKHKRSKTIVSQLSMESGILSDMSMTADQDHSMQHFPERHNYKTATLQSNVETSLANSVEMNPYLQVKRHETVVNL